MSSSSADAGLSTFGTVENSGASSDTTGGVSDVERLIARALQILNAGPIDLNHAD